jgi:uncharacterized Zn-binding protein involved in type VI secretion
MPTLGLSAPPPAMVSNTPTLTSRGRLPSRAPTIRRANTCDTPSATSVHASSALPSPEAATAGVPAARDGSKSSGASGRDQLPSSAM